MGCPLKNFSKYILPRSNLAAVPLQDFIQKKINQSLKQDTNFKFSGSYF
jgi:hypothetical protein